MNLLNPTSEPNQWAPPLLSQKVPRRDSLLHRVRHAKDGDGRPIPLMNELLHLLDDPPAEIADRWEAGVDLCRRHGIETSRMAVWRFYRECIRHGVVDHPAPPAA